MIKLFKYILLNAIGAMVYILDIYVKQAYNHYLSYKYQKKIHRLGKDVRFNGVSRISGLENIEIGNNVHIGDHAYIRAEGGLFIGDNVHISRNLVIYTHSHNYEGEALPYDHTFRYRKVTIEENVWIGINVTILPGTFIKEGAIIGAGAVVAGTVEAKQIIVAAKAVPLKYRNAEHYERLKKAKKFGGINGKPLFENDSKAGK